MDNDVFRLALITEVFFGEGSHERLTERLQQAAAQGAELALLPEIPLNPWSPAEQDPRPEDAEAPGGPRHDQLAAAARAAGVAVVGGAIVRDPESGRRFNRALVFDRDGHHVADYAKLHLPEEPGFWETSHYDPGEEVAHRIDGLGMPVGVQICSDANRPEGTHALAASGAELILVPRCTEPATWESWKLVLRANARTSACFVATANRTGPESGVPIGGPSAAFGPDGAVLLESEESVAVVELRRDALDSARRAYPGYLPVRAALYARAWGSAGT